MADSSKRSSVRMSSRLSRALSRKDFSHKGDVVPEALYHGRPTKQGFLIKHKCIQGATFDEIKAGLTKNWRKRWFAVIGNNLFYYKLPSDNKPKGLIELDGSRIQGVDAITGRKLCFAITTPSNKTFLIIAQTADAYGQWFHALEETIHADVPLTARDKHAAHSATEDHREDHPEGVKMEQLATESAAPPQEDEVVVVAAPAKLLPVRPHRPQVVNEVSLRVKRVRFKAKIQGVIPQPRSGHKALLVDGVRMLIHGGGHADGTACSDTPIFNLGSVTWSDFKFIDGSVPPSPRTGQSVAPYHESAYVMGGLEVGGSLLNDVFELNTDEMTWTKIDATGQLPQPRQQAMSAVVNSSLWVVGGKKEDGTPLTDVHVLDLNTNEWRMMADDKTELAVTGAACEGAGEMLVVWGGRRPDGRLTNDVTIFNTRNEQWVPWDLDGEAPPMRERASTAVFKSRIVFIIGGWNDEGALNDTWAIDVLGHHWLKVPFSGNPLPCMAGASICVKDHVLYMYGGDRLGKDDAVVATSSEVSVVKVIDSGLPTINIRKTTGYNESDAQRNRLHHLKMDDFEVGVTLGTGSFGRVSAVKYKQTGRWYAMKQLKKREIIALNQVDHINAEREVLSSISHHHVVNYYGSFQDSSCLYIVMEYVNGGEFFTHLRKAGRFPEQTARFYTAQVLTALAYLHSNDIVYRDLKPENLLLDSKGHAKVTDFGFAKQVEFRTWTLCGTPEYLAPEIILSKGHSKPADYWALGILAFEMLAGYPPFYDDDPVKIYEKILAGRIKWPYHMSDKAKDFIKSLLVADVHHRLGSSKRGANDIKNHEWFDGIDWDQMRTDSLEAPIRPKVKDEGDTSNFDRYPDDDQEDWGECTDAENKKFIGFGGY